MTILLDSLNSVQAEAVQTTGDYVGQGDGVPAWRSRVTRAGIAAPLAASVTLTVMRAAGVIVSAGALASESALTETETGSVSACPGAQATSS